MDDILKIKAELKDHVKVEMPYIFDKDTHIKYLTLKDTGELFYRGGQFCFNRGDSVVLTNGGRNWTVPINYCDKDGTVIYTTSFFIRNKIKKDKENMGDSRREAIILSQQEVIKKMTSKIKELESQLILNDS
jgi:hypothetical protein